MYDTTGSWEEYFMSLGIRNLFIKIQEYYFDSYEKYLIRKIRFDDQLNGPRQMRMMEHLVDYYRFIACFEIDPFVYNEITDHDIVYDKDETNELVFEFRQKYNTVKNSLSKSLMNETKKEVTNLIKNISKKNIEELNKTVINLFNMDEEFKSLIVSKK